MHGDHELDSVLVCRHCGAEASGPLPVRVNSPGWNLRGPVPAGELVLGIPWRGGAFDSVLPPRQRVTRRTSPGRASGRSGRPSGCAADGPGAGPAARLASAQPPRAARPAGPRGTPRGPTGRPAAAGRPPRR
jgi:hypothetical protein